MVHLASALVIVVLLGVVECRFISNDIIEDGTKDKTEKWGYVRVKNNSHIFYWLYYTTPKEETQKRPWIIWLQGGPGASSTGFGNFNLIGPLNVHQKPRNTTWIKQASVLFIDSPVGAGFSYVDDDSAYNTEVSEIIDDLMQFLQVFLRRHREFKTRPLYIFGASYGGKVAAYLSRRLYDEIQLGSIEANLIGFAMGNGWISPADYYLNFADFAFYVSLVDEYGRSAIQEQAENMKAAIDKGNWTAARLYAWECQGRYVHRSNFANVYDISKFVSDFHKYTSDLLSNTMELTKNNTLSSIVPEDKTWSDTRTTTFVKLMEHYMKPSISVVDNLLETTDLQVIIYQGQLDMICNTKGTMDWVQKLTWSNLTSYNSSERKPFTNPVDNQTEAFVKAYGKFKFYTILGSGHGVPHDKGDAAFRMLDRILNNLDQ